MRNRLYLAAAVGLGSLLLAGCSQTPCDRASKFDLNSKAGDCQLTATDTVLGPRGTCDNAMDSCSDADKKVLDGIVTCFENLPVCSSAESLNWLGQSLGCYGPVSQLSEGCRTALFGDDIPGEQDAGVDAGVPDAGYPPDETDAGALNLFITADETRIAMAWTQSQPGTPDHWEVIGFTAADVRETGIQVPPEDFHLTQDVGTGVKKKYYVLGLNAAGEVISGELDAGTEPETDGGTAGCTGALDCPTDQVCNLGTCQALPCTNSNVCPAGYLCDTAVSHVCERQFGFNDGGVTDAGVVDAGTEAGAAAAFVSELVEATTSAPSWSEDRVASLFAGRNVDLAAIDTARQFIILEQESQIFGYWTDNRGKTWRSVPIDPIGLRPKVTYEPQSKTLFACYNALGGVRVRRSLDFGKTWDGTVEDLSNTSPDDGGTPLPISDCDIAPWQNGTAAVAAIEGDTVKMWFVTRSLENTVGPQAVFDGTGTNYSGPAEVAIATLPSDSIIHVAFSARPAGTGDSEVLGMYRASGSTAFVGPKPLHKVPSSFQQTAPSIAIDPVTKRAIAAFNWSDGALLETVYVSMWSNQAQEWVTGSDLNVFAMNSTNTGFLVMPDRVPGDDWAARSPSVAITADGRITIAFAAGKVETGSPFLKFYSVGFDFEKFSPLAQNAKGWFLEPAVRSPTETRIVRAGSREISGPVLAVDPQISVYSAFVEGVGMNGDTPNRPVVISNPR